MWSDMIMYMWRKIARNISDCALTTGINLRISGEPKKVSFKPRSAIVTSVTNNREYHFSSESFWLD